MAQETHNVIRYPLFFFKICGRNPYMSWKRYLFSTFLYTVLFFFMYVSILANFFYIDDIFQFVENCEAMAVVFQMYAKASITIFIKNKLINLIDTAKEWNYEESSSSVKKEIESILKNAESFQKLYARALGASAMLVMVTPIFKKQCVSGMWNIPDQETLYIIILVIQEIACPAYVCAVIAVDGLFLGLSMLLTTQFRILRSRLKDLKIPDIPDEAQKKHFLAEVRKCIKLHDFLLQYGILLSKVYSPIMLLEFLSICMTSFAEMYLILRSDSLIYFIRGVLLYFTFMLELAFYSVAATITTDEAAEVANSLYESDWYSQYIPKLSTTLVTVISRAQHKLLFTAGGLTDMNLYTLAIVGKFSWSACTIMRGIRKE